MEQKDSVPYIVFESTKATMERTVRRLWILAIILIVLLVGSNVVWIYYENQFATETITQEVWQDADNGINRFVGGDYYGTAEGEDNPENQIP